MDGDGIRLVMLLGGVIATIVFNIGLVVWHGSKLVTKIESLTRRAERCDNSSERLFEKTDQIEVRLAVMDKSSAPSASSTASRLSRGASPRWRI